MEPPFARWQIAISQVQAPSARWQIAISHVAPSLVEIWYFRLVGEVQLPCVTPGGVRNTRQPVRQLLQHGGLAPPESLSQKLPWWVSRCVLYFLLHSGSHIAPQPTRISRFVRMLEHVAVSDDVAKPRL